MKTSSNIRRRRRETQKANVLDDLRRRTSTGAALTLGPLPETESPFFFPGKCVVAARRLWRGLKACGAGEPLL